MKAPYSKIVLITGATSGIGKATSERFAKQGYNLILTGRRLSILEELKKKYTRKFKIKVKILNFAKMWLKALNEKTSIDHSSGFVVECECLCRDKNIRTDWSS